MPSPVPAAWGLFANDVEYAWAHSTHFLMGRLRCWGRADSSWRAEIPKCACLLRRTCWAMETLGGMRRRWMRKRGLHRRLSERGVPVGAPLIRNP